MKNHFEYFERSSFSYALANICSIAKVGGIQKESVFIFVPEFLWNNILLVCRQLTFAP
jgi:hypothetical protein